MSGDDPFGLDDGAARTRLPGQPVPGPAAAPPPPGAPAEERLHANPLVAAFAPLLEIAPELATPQPPADIGALRLRVDRAMQEARDAAVARAVPLSLVNQAVWCVGALIDDVVLNSPWGANSPWARNPIVSALFGEVDAGTRFFERLDELEQNPARNREILELMYLCLSLGFRGKYHVRGAEARRTLGEVWSGLGRKLRDPESRARPLSARWQGVEAPDRPQRFAVPLWVLAVTAAALVVAIYAGLAYRQGVEAEALQQLATSILPEERSTIYRTTPARPLPVAEDGTSIVELLPAFLASAPDGTDDALRGDESTALVTLVLQHTSPELFRSGRAELTPAFEPLVAAIAGVLAESRPLVGGVRVVGHTDSIAVGRLNPFGSNQGLSEARARTVVELLRRNGLGGIPVTSEGVAASQPVASNATREGRALNRRVEILIEKRI